MIRCRNDVKLLNKCDSLETKVKTSSFVSCHGTGSKLSKLRPYNRLFLCFAIELLFNVYKKNVWQLASQSIAKRIGLQNLSIERIKSAKLFWLFLSPNKIRAALIASPSTVIYVSTCVTHQILLTLLHIDYLVSFSVVCITWAGQERLQLNVPLRSRWQYFCKDQVAI